MDQEAESPLAPNTIFSNEELTEFSEAVVSQAPHFIEIKCGCTSTRYGDEIGILIISDDGNIRIRCQCSDDCKSVARLPEEFAKHGTRSTNIPNWRKRVWVLNRDGKKVKVSETCLLRYYNGDRYKRPRGNVHRDEFLDCRKCKKQRRFELRSREVCRAYHDAMARAKLAGDDFSCSHMMPGRWTCEDKPDRKKKGRGCRRKYTCKGCTTCVCFGCTMCRFEDCNCRPCSDFYANNAPM